MNTQVLKSMKRSAIKEACSIVERHESQTHVCASDGGKVVGLPAWWNPEEPVGRDVKSAAENVEIRDGLRAVGGLIVILKLKFIALLQIIIIRIYCWA